MFLKIQVTMLDVFMKDMRVYLIGFGCRALMTGKAILLNGNPFSMKMKYSRFYLKMINKVKTTHLSSILIAFYV